MNKTQLRDRALGVLGWPVLAVSFGVLFVIANRPRRLPDLKRLVRDGLRDDQSFAAAEANRHFDRIGEAAPWLDSAGRQIFDCCQTKLGDSQVILDMSFRPGVSCTRKVTVVYGADGSLDDRLAELRAALSAAGWTIAEDRILSVMAQAGPFTWPVMWSVYDRRGIVSVGWASRGQPPEPWTGWIRPQNRRIRVPTVSYQPIEVDGTDIDSLARQTLARHQHAIAIQIQIDYYENSDPDGLRKKLLPRFFRPPPNFAYYR